MESTHCTLRVVGSRFVTPASIPSAGLSCRQLLGCWIIFFLFSGAALATARQGGRSSVAVHSTAPPRQVHSSAHIHSKRTVYKVTKTNSGTLGFDLRHIEQSGAKIANHKAAAPPPAKTTSERHTSSINFPSQPIPRKGGASNRLGSGSGSRRYGPGRRISER